MELYLQMGHGMKSLAQEMIGLWGKGKVIISPVNFSQNQLVDFATKIQKCGGTVLFDPQMFYPKEGHYKLHSYDYWPNEGSSITSDSENQSINTELLRINNEINSPSIILPGKEINEKDFEYAFVWMQKSIDFFRNKSDKKILATLCLFSETVRDSNAIEVLVDRLSELDVDGFYIIPHPSNGDYIVSDPLWTIGIMKLITCLKLQRKQVIVGYTNHQGLLYSLSNIDGIASGTYMNTRSFVPSKFKSPTDSDVKHKSIWYYLPSAMCEYKVSSLDVAKQRGFLKSFEPQGVYSNNYSSMLFGGALPSSTSYKEANSFKHYLFSLKKQCDFLSSQSYKEAYNKYEFMLNSAETSINELKKRGISGQNRDFLPGIESNRIAMCAIDEDYGFRLQMDWGI